MDDDILIGAIAVTASLVGIVGAIVAYVRKETQSESKSERVHGQMVVMIEDLKRQQKAIAQILEHPNAHEIGDRHVLERQAEIIAALRMLHEDLLRIETVLLSNHNGPPR